jgi:hypothetical protein
VLGNYSISTPAHALLTIFVLPSALDPQGTPLLNFMMNRVLAFAACYVCSLQAADVLVEAGPADNLQLIELDPNRLEVRTAQ